MGSEREDERAVLARGGGGGCLRSVLLRVFLSFSGIGMVGCLGSLLRRIGTRCGSGGVAASGGCN